MLIEPTSLPGAFTVTLDKLEDDRGFFARAWCLKEFEAVGLNTRFVQANISNNSNRGTVRGMHFQKPPGEEAKLVRCISGSVMDVIVDIRPHSPTFLEKVSVQLSPDNGIGIFVPAGFAHGFQTLEDNSTLYYEMTDYYRPDQSFGIKYCDPLIAFDWPLPIAKIAERDANYPDAKVEDFECFSAGSSARITLPKR